ncbi:YciI family protein [uncultured Arthrobacter sp.]|uniref:YciI family protein n=1 Tax=uncultured Arthrobacter sp. TaxID=114050 RepID=UPI002627C610|nr:YciI family protein [uncultured Arthrobacter sp.]
MPNYLIAFNDEWVPEQTTDELHSKSEASHALLEEMRTAGVFVFADGGIDASTALCSVVSKDGRPVFTDGPFAETKEHLGGFTVVEVPDDDAARYWAGRLAVALDWPQEVHRFPSELAEIIDRRLQESE